MSRDVLLGGDASDTQAARQFDGEIGLGGRQFEKFFQHPSGRILLPLRVTDKNRDRRMSLSLGPFRPGDGSHHQTQVGQARGAGDAQSVRHAGLAGHLCADGDGHHLPQLIFDCAIAHL